MRCNLSLTAQFSTVQASSTPDHTGLRFNEHIRAGQSQDRLARADSCAPSSCILIHGRISAGKPSLELWAGTAEASGLPAFERTPP
jgi:hypothetical protein